MNGFTKAVLLGGVLACGTAHAAADEGYLFLDGNGVMDQTRVVKSNLGYGGRLGIGFSLLDSTNIEVGVFGNNINGHSNVHGRQRGAMVDLVQLLGADRLKPFVFGGAGLVSETLAGVSGNYPGIEIGGGVLYDAAQSLKIRASLSAMGVFNKDVNPDKNAYVDGRFNIGVLLPFGAASAAPAPVAAPKVVDSDGDGIPDSQDRCPNVAAATADGCPAPVAVEPPKDSDGDGVPDSQDSCPGTLAGAKVDAHGCLVEAASIVLKGVTFVTGSAKLTAEAAGELDKAAIALAGQPDVKVEVGGHTDSVGDAKKNTALSQARADAVRKYLIGKGIDAGRLTAKGYGSSKPIADNKTKEGRAENRRVELKVVR